MDSSDSRKRPLDGEMESGVTKRSNQGGDGGVHLKVLIPSVAAGAIIGKGGETITRIQQETGATIKMSKANDYYPGTTERVCLITGTLNSVTEVHNFIMDKIRDKPDHTVKEETEHDKPADSNKQITVKILIPNSTAGMIIGKGGNFIRQIKEESGAYVQISQKSKDMNLPERCVTVAGSDLDQNRKALHMILTKIEEDPQSGSCLNISYADYRGPVASSNPTGSPFAPTAAGGGAQGMGAGAGSGGGLGGGGGGGGGGSNYGNAYGNLGTGMNNLHINSGGMGGGMGSSNPALENLKATLRGSGYTEQAVEEISSAMFTLANYGFLGLGLGLGGLNLGGLGLGNQGGNLNLANLAGILSGQNHQNNPGGSGLGLGNGTNAGAGGDTNAPSVFGPVGSTTTTMAGGDTGEGSGSYFSTASGMGGSSGSAYSGGGDSMFGGGGGSGNTGGGSYGNGSNAFGSSVGNYGNTNQNSFGLGTGMGYGEGNAANSNDETGQIKKEMQVGEHIVGAILGPGGRGIVELQKYSGANIQISKKGVYAPGTRNRVVTMMGTPLAIQRAEYLIQQRVTQEEAKRASQGRAQPSATQ